MRDKSRVNNLGLASNHALRVPLAPAIPTYYKAGDVSRPKDDGPDGAYSDFDTW